MPGWRGRQVYIFVLIVPLELVASSGCRVFFMLTLFYFSCPRSSTEAAGPHTPPASCDESDSVEATKCSSSGNPREKSQVRVDLVKLLRHDSEIDNTWRESKRVLHRTARRRSSFAGLL